MLDPKMLSAPANDSRLDSVLGEIEAVAQDTTLLAFTMALEAARIGPMGRNSALVAEAMCSLSIRANAFSTRVRAGLPRLTRGEHPAELANLQRVGHTVTEILNQAVRLAGDDLDGTAVDETAHKDSSQLLEQIRAHIGELDALLSAGPVRRAQVAKSAAGQSKRRRARTPAQQTGDKSA